MKNLILFPLLLFLFYNANASNNIITIKDKIKVVFNDTVNTKKKNIFNSKKLRKNLLNNTGKFGLKIGKKIKDLLTLKQSVPDNYVYTSPISFVNRTSFYESFDNKGLLKDSKVELKVLYPKISKGKGYLSFQIGDFTYFKYIKDVALEDIEYIKLKSKDGKRECYVEKFQFFNKGGIKNHYSFLLDHSGSMGEKRANILQNSIFKSIQKNYSSSNLSFNAYSIYKFSTYVKHVVSSGDLNVIKSSILPTNGLDDFGGATSIKDALIRSIDDLKNDEKSNNKLIVLFTDGDTNSDTTTKSINLIVKDALINNINIVCVGFGEYFNINELNKIANNSGGNVHHIYSEEEFEVLFDNIFQDFYSSYSLEFSPCMFGEEIEIEIKMKGVEDNSVIGTSVFRSPPEEGFVIDLNILFETNSWSIQSEYFEKLDGLVSYMNLKDFSIKVEGHTDKVGGNEVNKELSLKRAESVKDYLVSNGVDSNRIKVFGYGEEKPAYDYKDGLEENVFNRRIEIVIE